MSDYTPKAGDRVRVVLEGPVRETGRRGFYVGEGDGRDNYIVPAESHVVSIEKLPDPEPEWQPGDVVLSALGWVYERRRDSRWATPGSAVRHSNDFPERPLTLLVRNGKPVQP